jgi:hypothetical protein
MIVAYDPLIATFKTITHLEGETSDMQQLDGIKVW